MSLVNDMLNDLEARRVATSPCDIPEQWFVEQDESSTARSHDTIIKQRDVMFVVSIVTVIVLLIVVLWQFLHKHRNDIASSVATSMSVQQVAAVSNQVDTASENGKPGELSFFKTGDIVSVRLQAASNIPYNIQRSRAGLIIKLVGATLKTSDTVIDTVHPISAVLLDQFEDAAEITLTIEGEFRHEVSRQFDQVSAIIVRIIPVVEQKKSTVHHSPETKASVKLQTLNTVSNNDLIKNDLIKKDASVKKMLPLSDIQKDQLASRQASGMIAQRRYESAEQILNDIIIQQKQAPQSVETLISLLLLQRKFDQAQKLLTQLQNSDADNLNLKAMQARLYLVDGDAVRAVELLKEATPPVRVHTDYYELLAQSAQRAKQFLLAERIYRLLLDINSSSGDWWVGLAVSLDAQGHSSKARQAYRKALASDNVAAALRDYANTRLSVR